jgi:hypothetical protein
MGLEDKPMKMEDAKVRMAVQTKDGQRAVIVAIKPNSKHYAEIQFDGITATTPYPIDSLKKVTLRPVDRDLADGYTRYIMDPERALRPWNFTRWYPELAWVIGYAAQTNAELFHSGQPNGGRPVEDEFEFGASSNGEKFDVIMPNPNFAKLDDVLDINFIHRSGLRVVSLNKEGFWRFLESLNFQTGRDAEQNVHVIRQSIPEEYVAEFDAGAREGIQRGG